MTRARTSPAHTRLFALTFALALAFAAATPAHPRPRVRRQLAEDNSLQPEQEAQGEVAGRQKRKLEGLAQAGFGIKNAVLGFAFGEFQKAERVSVGRYDHVHYVQSGTTWRRQARATIDQPQPPTSLLPEDTPEQPLATTHQRTATPQQQPTSHQRPLRATQEGLQVFPLSPLLPKPTEAPRQQRQTQQSSGDDIPVFDRNKVSLDFPGNLFGPSVSLLIKTTKIVGDVIQNSAVRYQTFLRLFRPLFRGPFEIKGLDPPTTTTTTTTPAPADNEVRRRRRA